MMLLKMLMMINSMLSLSFMLMNHPLSMGLMLILQTVFVSLMIGMISQSFWFSYILFLVIIGGMLILFMYVISLIFNKIFINKMKLKFLFILLFIPIILITNQSLINNFETLKNFNLLNLEISLNLLKLYNYPMNLLNLLMINYLFFLLVVVVKITNFYYGPLRMKI